MDEIRGTYQLERKIETGGAATVWEASHVRTGRRVALKALHPHLVDDETARARFAYEADLMLSLDHPNIVDVFEFSQDDRGPYIVMELLGGTNLQRLIERSGRVDPPEASRIVRETATGVAHAHRHGFVHRDIKPANIVVDGDRVVVVDFGIASSPGHDRHLASENAVVGTLPYMAPERAVGQPGDESTDVYALGMVLYELVTGSAPFKGKTPEEIVVQQYVADPEPPSFAVPVPEDLERIVLKALQLAPRDRYRSAIEFLQQLEAAEAGLSVLPTLVMKKARRPKRSEVRRIRRSRADAQRVRTGPAYAVAGALTTMFASWAIGL